MPHRTKYWACIMCHCYFTPAAADALGACCDQCGDLISNTQTPPDKDDPWEHPPTTVAEVANKTKKRGVPK